LNSKKMPRITVKLTTKSLSIIKLLYSVRIIQNYVITTQNNVKCITFCSYYYKGVPYFSHFKVVSTPSKTQTVSFKALRVINKSLGNSILLLETDKGIVTHIDAISYGIGGRVLGVIS
jgi:ribosomal protein S8